MAGRPGTSAAPAARPVASGARPVASGARPAGRRGPPRAILNALMSLAVIVLEWRIRKALRSGADPGRQPG
jgi:hypothetical protein